MLQFPQFPSPCAATLTVYAQNIKLCEGALQALISKQFKVVLSACWTGFVLSVESVTTCAAEVGATTTSQVWVSEYQATYRTLRLQNTWRWFSKLTIVSSKCLLLCPTMRFCSSLSSMSYLGGWSFFLLSKFCLLCMYTCVYVCRYVWTTGLHHCSCLQPQVYLSSDLCSVMSLSAMCLGDGLCQWNGNVSRFRHGVKRTHGGCCAWL